MFMGKKKEKSYGRMYHVAAVLGGLIVISGVIAVILLFISYQHEQNRKIEELNQTIDTMYSEEQMNSLLEENRVQTEQITQDRLFGELKGKLSDGNSAVSVLRPYYPGELVIVSNGIYHFVPVRDDLKKHNLKEENLLLSEDGEFTYQAEDGTVSHKGIDVSKYQGDIDWKKVKNDGVEYAIIRVGVRGYKTGELSLDERFEKNIKGAHAAGIKVGVYFFSQAISVEEAEEEADFVGEQLEPYRNMVDYPVVFDVEKVAAKNGRMNFLTKEERTEVTVAFCERIRELGYNPMIYGNLEMFGVLIDLEPLEKYPKWFAYYDDSIYYPYDFKIWQYSAKGNVNGIEGDVDMNISFSSMEDLTEE